MSKKNMSDAEFERVKAQHDKDGGALAQQYQRQAQGCWDSGIKIIQGCGHMAIPEYLIRFSQLAHEKIECLKRSYPTLEWLAYLEGEVNHETREVTVVDLVIPDSQVVTGGHVGQVEYGWNEGKQICGVIHSHNTMGAFFSGTDDAYINQNHDVSICVSTAVGREICGQVRVKTPCGSYIINEKVKFKVDWNQVLDEKAFVDEFSPKIRTPRVLYRGSSPAKPSGKGVQDASSVRGGQPQNRTSGNGLQSSNTVQLAEDPAEMSYDELYEELLNYYTEEEIEELHDDDGVYGMEQELKKMYDQFGITYELVEEDEAIDFDNVLQQTEMEWDVDMDNTQETSAADDYEEAEAERNEETEEQPKKVAIH
jgi:hypothetical protein